MDLSLPLAASAGQITFGLILIFVVLFPVVVTGLIVYAGAQSANEHQQNLDDFDGVAER